MLADYVFSPRVDMIDQTLLQHLAAQRRGFAFRGRTEDPKLHQRVLGIQQDVLNHLLHQGCCSDYLTPGFTERLRAFRDDG